ncbi:ABC transporter family protein (plasmid) [Ochrobactrum quorumnocens]|uniref:ABC transporter family protein n=2 Tax=Ochrobactrum quorumnocens TaxID=271865 RepID=A0A248UN89_9HYPH|nr:ABC transporter family protein [[Ochrobactrum] quorumnocens]
MVCLAEIWGIRECRTNPCEGRQIFKRLTVEGNLVAAHVGRMGKSFDALREEVFGLFPVLKERSNGMGSRMSGEQQQMLAIGRVLMSEPRLLMLDEPS